MSADVFASMMQGGGWAVFAVVAAAFSAVFYLVNQYLRQPGYLIVFWMRVIAVVALAPVIGMFAMPTDPRFYIGVALTVFFSTYGDIRTFDVSAKYGGGVVSRLQPLIVWGSFAIWFAFDPSLMDFYFSQPLRTLGICAALGGCVYFAMRMNRSPMNREAFKEMLPALGAYVMTTVLNKYALMHGSMNGAVFGYMFVQSLLAVFFAGGYAMWRIRNPLPLRAITAPALNVPAWSALPLAALMIAAAWICHMIYKNYAMIFTVNPAYVAALGLTAPVFIALYYRIVKHKEQEETLSGYGIVACALFLVLLTIRA